jgi:Kef-type K+ transport system membrane component KefB
MKLFRFGACTAQHTSGWIVTEVLPAFLAGVLTQKSDYEALETRISRICW